MSDKKAKSLAEEWEQRTPGIVDAALVKAQQNPDSSVLGNVADFFAWEPTEQDRKAIAALGRKRRGEPLTDEDRIFLFRPRSEWP